MMGNSLSYEMLRRVKYMGSFFFVTDNEITFGLGLDPLLI